VFDVPLLAESAHWRQRVDRVLVVDCREETQIARVVARNGMTAEAVRQIIAAQAPRTTRLAAADSVICNDGVSLDQLRAQVDRFAAYFGL
jgi:dephospho-CoA kinase